MSGNISKHSIIVTPDMIDSVIVDVTGQSTYLITTDYDGSAIVTVTMISNGCITATGVNVLLKDTILWDRLHCTFTLTGYGSCWGFNGNNGYGSGLTATQLTGNLLAYNAALGDSTREESNVWDRPQFTKRFSACDNASNNYMHGSYAYATRSLQCM